MIIGGDFRQVLPIRKFGGKNELLSLSIKTLELFKKFQIIRLKENRRALPEQKDFAKYLEKLGEGRIKADEHDFIELPDHCIAQNDLITEVFGELIEKQDHRTMANRVILTTTNEKTCEYNEKTLELIDSRKNRTYISTDKIDDDQPKGYIEYPLEFLHSLQSSGLPPHELKLKENVPVMLLRNLNPAAGLCNGTRLLVKVMHDNILECELLTGERTGERVFIPKITLTSEPGKFPFTLFRRQFPIRLCYAMTINKSQGQTLDFVGLDLVDPVFSHGMAYVGFSRVKSWDDIKVAVDKNKGNKIKNIVWKEALLEDLFGQLCSQ